MTKDEILNMLRSASAPISGEEMSRALGVSRAAVWKAVDQLRQEGYAIEAATRRGYRLAALPDRLDAAVRFAQGSIGRAASFLTPASQEASRAAADFCALLFAKGGAFALAAQALPLSAKRDGFDAFLAFVELYLLDVLHTHTGGPLLLAPSAAEEYRAASTRRGLCGALDALSESRARLAANANGRLTATLLCTRLSAL